MHYFDHTQHIGMLQVLCVTLVLLYWRRVPSGELASECLYIEHLYKSDLTMKDDTFSKYLTDK